MLNFLKKYFGGQRQQPHLSPTAERMLNDDAVSAPYKIEQPQTKSEDAQANKPVTKKNPNRKKRAVKAKPVA